MCFANEYRYVNGILQVRLVDMHSPWTCVYSDRDKVRPQELEWRPCGVSIVALGAILRDIGPENFRIVCESVKGQILNAFKESNSQESWDKAKNYMGGVGRERDLKEYLEYLDRMLDALCVEHDPIIYS